MSKSLSERLAEFPKREYEVREGIGTSINKCEACGRKIHATTTVVIETIRVSFMRGDDRINVICIPCAKLAKVKIDPGFDPEIRPSAQAHKCADMLISARHISSKKREYWARKIHAEYLRAEPVSCSYCCGGSHRETCPKCRGTGVE